MRHTTAKQSIEILVKDQLESLPECCDTFCITNWDYTNWTFDAQDRETGKRYKLDLPTAVKGLAIMRGAVSDREIPGIFKFVDQLYDAEEWDGIAVDALVQYSLLGELVYG